MFPLRQLIKNARYTSSAIRNMSSSKPLVDLAVDNDGIAILTMQRLPMNILNLDLLEALSKALDDVSKNKAKGMVLTSSSSRIFSAGLDIMEIYKPDIKRFEAFWTTLQDVWLKLFGANYPTAAAINGHAPAGGCLLSMSCEYRAMVSGKFTIGMNETALNIVAPKWVMDTMCNIISKREAEYALTTGRMFSVDEALKVGLIDITATDKADAIAKSKQFIKKFDKISPLTRALTKQKMRAEPIAWLSENRKNDTDEILGLLQRPNVQQSLEFYLQAIKKKSGK